MIVCKQCGHENEDDRQFCDSCRAFLEWEGERTGSRDPGGSEPGTAMPPGSSGTRPSSPPTTPAGGQKTGETPHGPAAVLPGEEREAPPPRRGAGDDLGGGNLVCSSCGQGNESTRSFCRRCGNRLDQPRAPTPGKTATRKGIPWGAVVRVVLALLAVAALVVAIVGPP